MPRSPSPPRRWRSYREDSPPRRPAYPPRDRDDDRSWGNYHRQRDVRERDREGHNDRGFSRRDREYERPRSRSPTRQESSHSHPRSTSPEEGQITSPPPRSNSPQKSSPLKRSISPLKRPPSPSKRPSWAPQPPYRPEPSSSRLPPSGPRSERVGSIPTGPRALSGYGPRPQPPSFDRNPSDPRMESAKRPETQTTVPHVKIEPTRSPPKSVNPYSTPAPAGPSQTRISWSERKSASVGVSPQATASIPSPIPPTPSGGVSPTVRVEDVELDREREQNASVFPKSQSQTMSEVQVVETRARQEEAKIMAELPDVKVSFSMKPWEIELNAHYQHLENLQRQTQRAQSASRVAAAVLADAEAERVAAGERRKVAEAQLVASSLGVSSVGLISGL